MSTTDCPQTCPMGPPGPQGESGQKGDPGIKGESGSNSVCSSADNIKARKVEPVNNRDWCNLHGVIIKIITQTILSTSKNIIMLKPDSGKTFNEAEKLCKSICGRIYFPASLAENNQVIDIALKGGSNIRPNSEDHDIWLRFTDEEAEGISKDPENRDFLTFKNWRKGQPNNVDKKQHHACFTGTLGRWNDMPASTTLRHVICEL